MKNEHQDQCKQLKTNQRFYSCTSGCLLPLCELVLLLLLLEAPHARMVLLGNMCDHPKPCGSVKPLHDRDEGTDPSIM